MDLIASAAHNVHDNVMRMRSWQTGMKIEYVHNSLHFFLFLSLSLSFRYDRLTQLIITYWQQQLLNIIVYQAHPAQG